MRLITGKSLTTLRNDAQAAVIDEGATTVVYETTGPRRLFAIDLSSGRSWQIGPDDRDSYQPVLSADGRHLLYLSMLGDRPQLFDSRVDGSEWRQLTGRGDGIAEATLSGNGAVALAVTGDGSILRIEVESGLTKTVVGPTPVVGYVRSTTPGSLTRVSGKGLANSTIVVDDIAAPILSRSAEEIMFQMPWETQLDTKEITIPEGGGPYFEDAAPMGLSTFAPFAFALGPRPPASYYTPVAIHADFKFLVTEENPARPGELVHLYLAGGGPVTVPVPTGVPNPIGPLSRITTEVLVVANSQTPLDVPFIGLAPGFLGVWQMDVYLPADWHQSSLSIDILFHDPPQSSYWSSSGARIHPDSAERFNVTNSPDYNGRPLCLRSRSRTAWGTTLPVTRDPKSVALLTALISPIPFAGAAPPWFGWDPVKAKANFSKHGDFEQAAQVFRDPLALTIPDQEHSAGEVRWITLRKDMRGQYSWWSTGSSS